MIRTHIRKGATEVTNIQFGRELWQRISQVYGWAVFPKTLNTTRWKECAPGESPVKTSWLHHTLHQTECSVPWRYGAIDDINIKHSERDTFVFVTYKRLDYAEAAPADLRNA